MADNIYAGQEVNPGERAIGPHIVKQMQGFDPNTDLVFKYRLDLTDDLFNTFCTLISTNESMPNFCRIITPPDRDLMDPNCYYNYYIEVGLDDEHSMGMSFKNHTDVEVMIAFRQIKCTPC